MANLRRSERSIRPPDLDGSHHLEITGNQLERWERFYLFPVVPHESTAVLQNRVGLNCIVHVYENPHPATPHYDSGERFSFHPPRWRTNSDFCRESYVNGKGL